MGREGPVVESREQGAVQEAARVRVPGRRLLRPGRRLERDQPPDLGRGGRIVAVLLRRPVAYSRRVKRRFDRSPTFPRSRPPPAPCVLSPPPPRPPASSCRP